MRIYDVESQTKYHIKLTEIDNIEDAGEHFVTEDELKEMGIDARYGVSTWRPTTFDKKIKAELNRLVKKINKSSANSCKIDDDELVEMFVDTKCAVSDFVKGLRRVGNRLSLHSKKEKSSVNKRDAKRFLDSAVRFINHYWNTEYGHDDNDFCLEVRGGLENICEGTFMYIVHNMEWNEYVNWVKDDDTNSWVDEDDLQWYKLIYDNPAIFNVEDDD